MSYGIVFTTELVEKMEKAESLVAFVHSLARSTEIPIHLRTLCQSRNINLEQYTVNLFKGHYVLGQCVL